VRIPLDYYQILGLPENDLAELEQAYRDRLLQLPRQEYSDAAIESRKRLIGMAYQVLSDPQQRSVYIASQAQAVSEASNTDLTNGNLATTPVYYRPTLDIAPEYFLGGLLVLFELGEYEEINSICMPYLGTNGRNSNSGSLHPEQPLSNISSGNVTSGATDLAEPLPLNKLKQTVNGDRIIPLKPDILLAMVSSFWELAEREWRDGCYEEAVIHYETAKKILVQEDLFPQIQGEIDRRLDRLRPYRISSLVSLPLDRHEQRRKGIQFLEELLESACTNEVKCQERFALNSETTIPFIHETLPHLTAAEQRNLFSQLAKDSQQSEAQTLNVMQLACTYLHVHALIAQGFAYRNPQSIYTAQQVLQYRLQPRINVSIEQAVCALLLGQTEAASKILAQAPESADLVVIRQQSQGYANLLRGLCWHIESWLKNESFPCFRDLVTKNPSIHDYFNDRDVQEFADRVPTNDLAIDSSISGWAKSQAQLIDVAPSGDLSGSIGRSAGSLSADRELIEAELSTKLGSRTPSGFHNPSQTDDRLGVGNIIPAVRVEQIQNVEPVMTSPTEELSDNNVIQLGIERKRRRSGPTARMIDGQLDQTAPVEQQQPLPLPLVTSSQLVPAAKAGRLVSNRKTASRTRRTRRRPNIPRILLVGTSGAACLWGIGWLANAGIQAFNRPTTVSTISASPSTAPSQLPTRSPDRVQSSPTPQIKPASVGLLTNDAAQSVITKWLSAKTKSLSSEYQVSNLKDVLVEPALSSVADRAKTAQANGIYWQYSHQNIGIESVVQASSESNFASVRARVTEDAQLYEGKALNPARSYSKPLLIEYSLVRNKDGWFIKDMDVVR
jgi:ARC6-like, IMS domain/DnaJ domain